MPSGIKTTNISQGGTLTGATKKMKLAFVGKSNGQLSLITDKALTFDSTSQVIDSTASIESISKVSLYSNDSFNKFSLGVDYSLSGSNVLWLNKTMTPPVLEGSAAFTGSADTTTSFAVTVLDQNSNESTPSDLLELVYKTGSTTFTFYWTKVDFASGFKLYKKNLGNYVLLGTYDNLTTSATLASITGSGSYPLATNGTKRTPKLNDPFYISYYARTFDYTIQTMSNSKDNGSFFGIGSDLDNAGRLIFDDLKVAEAYVVATEGSHSQAYMDAVDKLNVVSDIPLLIVPLTSSKPVAQYAINACKYYSGDDIQKERYFVGGIVNTLNTLGFTSTANTILYELASYEQTKRAIFVIPNGNKVYKNTWRETNSSISENVLVGNHYFALAVAGLMVQADDTASSIGDQSVPGFTFGPTGEAWIDANSKDKVEPAGAIYCYSNNGTPTVYTDVTHDQSYAEYAERYIATAEDTMRDETRTNLRKGKILHKKLVKGKLRAAEQNIENTLADEVARQIIDTYRDVTCEQDKVVKTRVIIGYWYTPMYSIKEIFIQYSYDI